MILKKRGYCLTTLVVQLIFMLILCQPDISQTQTEEAKGINQEEKKQIPGTPVTLDFKDADLTEVLKLMAEINDYNIVIDPLVQGKVTIALHKDVPWEQAMDIILKTCNLSMQIEGKIIRIGPVDLFALKTEIIPLKYARALKIKEQLDPLLSKAKAWSEPPAIIVDERTNSLVIKDLATKIDNIKEILSSLDKETPQVMIQIRIVETTQDYARELGIQWGGRYYRKINYYFPNTIDFKGIPGSEDVYVSKETTTETQDGTKRTEREFAQDTSSSRVINLPNQGDITGGIGLSLGHVNGLTRLNVALESMETKGKGKIISNPRITTMDNEQAFIESGTEIPYPSVDKEGNPIVQFKDAKIILKVTPHITPDDFIIMEIVAEKSEPDWSNMVNGQPAIFNRRATTKLIAKHDDTVVIGGLYQQGEQTSRREVPWFCDIPLIGWLFRSKRSQKKNDELLIFITPTIMEKWLEPNQQFFDDQNAIPAAAADPNAITAADDPNALPAADPNSYP